MHQPIRISLLLSATALFAAACTSMDSQNSGYTDYNSPVATTNIPEAGPLSDPAPAANHYAAAPAANPVPAATVPQVPAVTNTPVANNTGSSYGIYAASDTNAAPVTTHEAPVLDYGQPQPQPNYNDSYTSYGPVNTPAANTAMANGTNGTNTTYDTYTNNSYDTYTTNNGNTGAGYNTNTAGGSAAIQVFATGSVAKAERIRQDMQQLGLPAVVDSVGGLYKVRIPYSDAGTARANLAHVRQASGEAGAFVTTR